MNKIKISIGDKFGQLTVISRAENHSTASKKTIHQWNCLCNCGSWKKIIGSNLIRGRSKHCGCLKDSTSKSNLKAGDKVNRLTLISYRKGKWECVCDCGEGVELKTNLIVSQNTKSCGCLNEDRRSERAEKMYKARQKFDPKITTARRVWKQYLARDKQCDLSFEDWMEISQKKCYYCGTEPHSKYNFFKAKSSRSRQETIAHGEFTYNGLDRVDSSKYHTKNNVVPCCYLCNRSKSNLKLEDFLKKINSLQVRQFFPLEIERGEIPKEIVTTVKYIFFNYKKDTDLSLEEFYWMTQLPCYYCGAEQFNQAKVPIRKKSTEDDVYWKYNGLDRIDSDKGHVRDNVVPCCKICNWSKGNMPLKDFNSWIKKVQDNIKLIKITQ